MTSEISERFVPDGRPVLIGSLPLDDHQQALEWIFRATPEIPLWPQLPHNPLEQMMPQFAEGVPCIVEEERPDGGHSLCFDIQRPGFEEDMLAFYEEYLAAQDDYSLLATSRFQVSRDRAEGLFLMCEQLESGRISAVKGQVTGPFTMLTGIKDREGRAGYHDETIRDMVIKAIAMKAAWQTMLLGRAAGGKPVLLFIDEPALAGLGSTAFIGVTQEEIHAMIGEVAEAVHRAGGLAGIHVCANTDWPVLLSSSIDILSFDAYGYFDRIAALKTEINQFLERGGILAWGGVPTSRNDDIAKETTASLCSLFTKQMRLLATERHPLASIFRQCLITPSCGTGSLSPEAAARVLDLTRSTAETLREELLQTGLEN